MNIYKTVLVFLLTIFISIPAFAAKPATTQYLAGGPIPISSGTETFSCNVLSHSGLVIFDFSIKICGNETPINCTSDKFTLGRADSLEEDTSEFTNSKMVTCEIAYEGQPGDVTGTVCMSDTGLQACVPLQEVEPTNLRVIN